MSNDQLELVIRLGLGIVFGLSAGTKLRDPSAFARGVSEYRFFSSAVPRGLALGLIPAEATFAFCHLTGLGLAAVAPACVAVLAVFTVAVVAQLSSGHRVPCMCFDPGARELISGVTVARLVLLIGAELYVSVVALGAPVRGSFSLIDMSIAFALASVLLVSVRWALNVYYLAVLLRPVPRPPSESTSNPF